MLCRERVFRPSNRAIKASRGVALTGALGIYWRIPGRNAARRGVDVSPELISAVTDAVLDEVAAWQARPLEPVYPLVFFDALRANSFIGIPERAVKMRPINP